jgi:amino acid transporter
MSTKKQFGTAPVFFTAISTILGAILFLRFGWAVGTLGFLGVIIIVSLGHLVTLPTALAISEIATNRKVEGGGEYFIISRSFGLNIGATIGMALYLSQAISVAFYVIAFTEAFAPVFAWAKDFFGMENELPRQVISVPAMTGLSILILRKGANMGVKTLYVVVAILFASLVVFFLGEPETGECAGMNPVSLNSVNMKSQFFYVFAIIFPAFTGMTAGVGLSGDLKRPGRSIPLGTTLATVSGMIIYVFISWKLAISRCPDALADENNYLIMADIARTKGGLFIIPLGLAASTISSAIGSIMVAPRTLQALSLDRSIPIGFLNSIMSKGKGKTDEPFNATLFTCILAMVFVVMGQVNMVAGIISMFFMVTYGSICLISFLYHFGADPSYRPVFKSRWYISLLGFLLCIWLMFKMNTPYAVAAIIAMVILYLIVSYLHRDRRGVQHIFQGAIFQLSRNIQIYIQKSKKVSAGNKWRPSVVCVSRRSFERDKAFRLLDWISEKFGFSTYIHLIEDYFSAESNRKATEILEKLIEKTGNKSNVFIDTMISPSYTSAIAQTIQLPGISGMPNNMFLFEFDRDNPQETFQIAQNIPLVKAGKLDVCILGSSNRKKTNYKKGIHVWIKSSDFENANLMILLSYIILAHPKWKRGKIQIFEVTNEEDIEEHRKKLVSLIREGRLPISPHNIEIIKTNNDVSIRSLVNERSKDAGLTLIGFREEQVKNRNDVFLGYDSVGDILFINSVEMKEI